MGSITASLAVALSAVCSNPHEDVLDDHVDLIEVNHYYDEHGKLVFDQLIFYDWRAKDGRFQVRDWKMIKKRTQLPRKNWRTGKFTVIWQEGDQLRKVRAVSVRETWTQQDPELLERDFLPKDRRPELARLRADKKRK